MTMALRRLGDLAAVPISTAAAVSQLDGAVGGLGRRISERIGAPRMIRLDAKDACPGGAWGINLNESKTWDGDPVHCKRARDSVQPPIVRVDVPCEDPGQLMWPDVFAEAQRVLRIALAGKPKPTDPWTLQARWTRQVMTLVSMAYEATNIQPIFMYPSEWSMRRPQLLFEGAPDNPRDLGLREWGEYAASLTYDGKPECLSIHGADQRLTGQSVPRRIQQWMGHQRRQFYRARGYPADVYNNVGWIDSCGRFPLAAGGQIPGRTQGETMQIEADLWTPAVSGLQWARGVYGTSTLVQIATPSFFNGPFITNNSPTNKALKGQSYDPWGTVGFGGRYREEVYPLIPQVMAGGPALRVARMDRDRARAIGRGYLNKSLDVFMNKLFQTTSMRPELFVPYIPREIDPSIRGVDRIQLGQWGPSARWYVELAAKWAEEVISLDFYQFITNAVLFYLRNHTAYYKRLYGDAAVSIPAEDLAAMADAIAASKRQMLLMPMTLGSQLLGLINPIAGALASVVGDISEGIMEWMDSLFRDEDLPKSLMRRLPVNAACEWSTASDIGRAGLLIAEQSRGTGGASDDPPAKTNPLLIAGGVGLFGLAAYAIWTRNK
jgi:hypothetical protein